MLSRSDIDTVGRLDATAQAALVRSGEVTAEELVDAAISRIERDNPALNAVITPAFDDALDRVRSGLPAGPFTGVPYLLKDLVAEAEGMRYTGGSRFLGEHVSGRDQELVARLRRAGLVILGKTNTPEFGLLPTTEPVRFGATRNPWDVSRTPGGSSGGSAAAVAAGLVPFAHGNDAGGSLRYPASCCGLFGFKPSRARTPLGPAFGDAFGGIAVEHALTRSVRDSATLLDATTGPDPGDPYQAPPPAGPFATEAGRDPGRLRLGYSLRAAEGHPVHPDCAAALHAAVQLCADLGHEVVECDLPGLTPEVGHAIGTVFGASGAWMMGYWIRRLGREPGPDDLEPLTRLYWQEGARISGGQYLLAMTDLQSFARTVAAFLADLDGWLTPTLAQPPPPLGYLNEPDRVGPFVAFAGVVANITGSPAMSLPLYWSPAGLPIGVHVLGRYGDDATLFRLAGQLERARPWAGRWPPVPVDSPP